MKKLLLLVIVCIVSLTIQAQTEHLKFMGIPLTGNIITFQNKLKAKGIKYDAVISKQLKDGGRAFKGTFVGEKANVYVYYNTKTKNVYRAKAVITCSSRTHGDNKYQEFEAMLKKKYSDHVASYNEQDGHPAMSILITDSKMEYTLGFVNLYMTNPPYSFMDEVCLHIDYEDMTNIKNNTNKNMDDL